MYIQLQIEREDKRVKGLSFHASEPLLAVGLHSGLLEVWDVETRSRVLSNDTAHNGPIRSVDFHRVQHHMLCTGGDDTVVRVWSIDQSQPVPSALSRELPGTVDTARSVHSPMLCASLAGHNDYIRSVQFHTKFSWILSGSDDQTLRIWDWMTRSCLVVCHGHAHYVMCARFHPTSNYIVSGSLDLSIRVWDITNLIASCAPKVRSGNARKGDLFDMGTKLEGRVTVRRVVEGHEKGVNWIDFHPTKECVVSAGDDRSLRVWNVDYAMGSVQEIDCIREHTHNVTCCLFDADDALISCSEDGSVRVWDIENKRQLVCDITNTKNEGVEKTHKSRYWALAKHESLPYIAAGHDFGIDVFCRSALFPVSHYNINKNSLLFCEQQEIRRIDFPDANNTDSSLQAKTIKRFKSNSEYSLPHRIAASPDGSCCLYAFSSLTDPSRGTHYALHRFSQSTKEGNEKKQHGEKDKFALIKECAGMPVFVSNEAFAHVDASHSIIIKSFDGATIQSISADFLREKLNSQLNEPVMIRSVTRLHSAPLESILIECSTHDGLLWVRFDLRNQVIIGTRYIDNTHGSPRFAVWNHRTSALYCLIVFDTKIIACDGSLSTVSLVNTNKSTIDSVTFDSGNFLESCGVNKTEQIFVFSAGNQIFFALLPSGEVGVLHSFPLRVSLIDANITADHLVYSLPVSEEKMPQDERSPNHSHRISIGERIYQQSLDFSAIKLFILSRVLSQNDVCITTTKAFTTKVAEKLSLPFALIRSIVESRIPWEISFRLLQCIDTGSQSLPEIQKWLFELGCQCADVEFAYGRLVKLDLVTKPDNAVSEGTKTLWKRLGDLSKQIGNFPLAQTCYEKTSPAHVLSWNAVTFGEGVKKGLVEDGEGFDNALSEILAGNQAQATESLRQMGFESLAQACGDREHLGGYESPSKSIDHWPMAQDKLQSMLRLSDYYEDKAETNLLKEETKVPNLAMLGDQELAEPESPQKPSKPASDPFDFIFESSDDE